MRAPMRLAAMMREAGLAEVESRMVQMPLNGWPTSKFPEMQPFLAELLTGVRCSSSRAGNWPKG